MSFTTRALARTTQVPIGSTTGTATSLVSSSFRYATNDAAATVETAGYFNNGRALLSVGDLIVASMAMASGTPVLKHYVVLTVPATGNVTIGLQTTAAG